MVPIWKETYAELSWSVAVYWHPVGLRMLHYLEAL